MGRASLRHPERVSARHPEFISASHPEFISASHPELVSGSITSATVLQWLKTQIARQVSPLRVRFLDQIDLPLPAPILDLLFSADRLGHRLKRFDMDETRYSMAFGEAFNFVVSMLVQALDQVAGNANVERAAIGTGQNVSARFADARHSGECARRWTLEAKLTAGQTVQGDEFGKVSPLQQRHAELVSASMSRTNEKAAG
jgi:hypothetical protein